MPEPYYRTSVTLYHGHMREDAARTAAPVAHYIMADPPFFMATPRSAWDRWPDGWL